MSEFYRGIGFSYESQERIRRMITAAIFGGPEEKSDLEKVANSEGEIYSLIAAYLLGGGVESKNEPWWEAFQGIIKEELKKYYTENISLPVLEKWRNILGVPGFPKKDQGMTLIESCLLWLHESEKTRGGAFNALLQGKVPRQKLGENLGYEVCEGLIACCEIGIIEVPETAKLRFLAAYDRWYNRRVANACPEYLQRALGIDLTALDDETVINLFNDGYHLAEYELGRRLINLPANNDGWAWNFEALKTLQNNLSSSVEEDGKKIMKGVEEVELYVLHEAHREKRVKNPDDPFDCPVFQLWISAGRGYDPYGIETPSYKKTLDYVQRHKEVLEEKIGSEEK